ncbi:MAG: hypothetical protein H7836_15935, partial [Magnetococcus sp. YQC-3]
MKILDHLKRIPQEPAFWWMLVMVSINIYVWLGVLKPLQHYSSTLQLATEENKLTLSNHMQSIAGLRRLETRARRNFDPEIFKTSVKKLLESRCWRSPLVFLEQYPKIVFHTLPTPQL